MGRTRVRRRELERPEGPHLARVQSNTAESRDDVGPVADRVLRLQQEGGNEAVGTMLAQREAAKAEDSDGAKDEAVSSTLFADDPIGVLPLLSFSRGSGSEMRVTLPSTAKDPVLMDLCSKGKSIGNVKISAKGVEITLNDVIISSCQAGGGQDQPTLSLTLNSAKTTFDRPQDPTGKVD